MSKTNNEIMKKTRLETAREMTNSMYSVGYLYNGAYDGKVSFRTMEHPHKRMEILEFNSWDEVEDFYKKKMEERK